MKSMYFILLLLVVFGAGCKGSPKYTIGECSYCKFEDDPQGALPKTFYKVTAVNSEAKTYSVEPILDERINAKSDLVKLLVSKVPHEMAFRELDYPEPLGLKPTCILVKTECPQSAGK